MALGMDSRLIGWFMVAIIVVAIILAIVMDPQEVALLALNPIKAILNIPTAIAVGTSNIITAISNATSTGMSNSITDVFNLIDNFINGMGNIPGQIGSAGSNAWNSFMAWLKSMGLSVNAGMIGSAKASW